MIATAESTRLPRSATALQRAAAAPWKWLRVALGIRRAIWVGQTRYKELGAEPLEHALTRRGSGAKEYRVRFADGRRMIITATRHRHYADLVGPRTLEIYQALGQTAREGVGRGGPRGEARGSVLRPGMRIVALQSGTGYIGAWLSEVVGPSGAVVALDTDPESIRYARSRYKLDNVAFETGAIDSLGGETGSAFDAAIAILALTDEAAAMTTVRELWRVLAPGGRLIVATELPQAAETAESRLRLAPPRLRRLIADALADLPSPESPVASVDIAHCPGFSAVIATARDATADR